jgi:hypothetical protein
VVAVEFVVAGAVLVGGASTTVLIVLALESVMFVVVEYGDSTLGGVFAAMSGSSF